MHFSLTHKSSWSIQSIGIPTVTVLKKIIQHLEFLGQFFL